MIFGGSVLRQGVVTSTQDIARDRARSGAAAGTVITADFQTHGRGRRGRVWYAPKGANVCLTAIAPPVPGADAWQVALVTGLAVAEGVAKIAEVRAHVRFPNDVLLGGAKLAGVLVETLPEKDGRVVPLIGIGINVHTAGLPPELDGIATSLERVTGIRRDIAAVERAVLRQLDLCWEEWEHGGLAATVARWNPLADPDARRRFLLDGRPVVCRVRDLAPDGMLTVETEAGSMCSLPASTVFLDDELIMPA